jgi:hypothetical protein
MACKRSSVRSRLPPPIELVNRREEFEFELTGFVRRMCKNKSLLGKISVNFKALTPSSRGLGHHPFTVSTGVRIPVGSPSFVASVFRSSVQGNKLVIAGSQEQAAWL